MAKKKLKKVVEKIDGLGPKDAQRLVTAIRKVWSWNYARKVCIARATDKNGFGKCEGCKSKVPKLYADHVDPVGAFDPRTFIERMFISSNAMQALCKRCHDRKTRAEAKARAAGADFF